MATPPPSSPNHLGSPLMPAASPKLLPKWHRLQPVILPARVSGAPGLVGRAAVPAAPLIFVSSRPRRRDSGAVLQRHHVKKEGLRFF